MKSLKNLLMFFVTMIICGMLNSQDVDEIINMYLDSMGGIEKLRDWKTLKGNGKYVMMTQGGKEISMTTWYKAPNKKRVDMIIDGQTASYSFDGKTSWFCDPSRGINTPTLMPEDQAKNNEDNADEYAFIDYKKKGYTVEFLGKEEFEGRDVYKVKLTRTGGSESFHFFDCQTGYEVKILIFTLKDNNKTVTEIVERDFKKIDWLLLPFSIETWVNGKMANKLLIEKAEINIEIDDSIFCMPKQMSLNE